MKRFEDHFKRNYGFLLNSIKRSVYDESVAEDILSQAYVKALASSTWDKVENLDTWFMSIVNNCIIDHFNTESADLSIFDTSHKIEWGVANGGSAEDTCISREKLLGVMHKIDEVKNPIHRSILINTLLYDQSNKDVATALGVTDSTVWNVINRFRKSIDE